MAKISLTSEPLSLLESGGVNNVDGAKYTRKG
jgi:hypothetical protein